MNQQCIFCRIVAREVQTKLVFEDEEVIAFRDISPVAPTHILIVPRVHIASVNDLDQSDAGMVGRMVLRAKEIAKEEGIASSGYRLVFNNGPDSGQVVKHLHMHLLGGRPLGGKLG
ncbi:MAG: histidine triad nucleotide-binding protein [Chloroflexi bacterium]|nr:histidine triad nucleotide-binding protein [Chloroflexota bacterium]